MKGFKYKLNLTKSQRLKVDQTLGNARFVFNYFLDRRIKQYEDFKKSGLEKKDFKRLTYFDDAKTLTELKKIEGFEWLKVGANETLQQSLRNLESSYLNFFKQPSKGFPKFKSKKQSKQSVKYTHVKIDFDKWRLHVPNIGNVKIFKNRFFDVNCLHKSMTISKDNCGEYWVSILVETNEETKPLKTKEKLDSNNTIGIDLGIKSFTVLSNGEVIDNPKFKKSRQRDITRVQRMLAKRVKVCKKNKSHLSKRGEKLKLRLAKIHRKVHNQRMDFIHKLTVNLINSFDCICLEDLNVKGMMRNHNLAFSIADVSWSEFVRVLKYKADWNGVRVIQIDRFESSSQSCHVCGYKNADVKNLNVMKWTCPQCGTHHDRDVNAAINIRNIGLKSLNE